MSGFGRELLRGNEETEDSEVKKKLVLYSPFTIFSQKNDIYKVSFALHIC